MRKVARHTEGLVPRGADGDQRCSDSLNGEPSSWMRGKSFYDGFRGSAPEGGDPYRTLPVTDPLISAKHRCVCCEYCSILTRVSLTPNYMHSEQLSRPAQSFGIRASGRLDGTASSGRSHGLYPQESGVFLLMGIENVDPTVTCHDLVKIIWDSLCFTGTLRASVAEAVPATHRML